jgi:hypothetical protein
MDPKKCIAVFGKDHAQSKTWSMIANAPVIPARPCSMEYSLGLFPWTIPLGILLTLKIFPAKSIRHKTAYKADNIARRWLRRRGGREPCAAEGL